MTTTQPQPDPDDTPEAVTVEPAPDQPVTVDQPPITVEPATVTTPDDDSDQDSTGPDC